MKACFGITGDILSLTGLLMVGGMFLTPWLDFTEFTVAPAIGFSPELAWALATSVTVFGLLVLGAFFEARADEVVFK